MRFCASETALYGVYEAMSRGADTQKSKFLPGPTRFYARVLAGGDRLW